MSSRPRASLARPPASGAAARSYPYPAPVLATIISAAIVCLGALVLGQTALGLCGAVRWSWLSPAIGIAIMMLIAVPALHVPGRSLTTAVVLVLAVCGALAYVATHPAQRPPIAGLLAGLPVFLLALVPFAAAGRAGTLGVAFNNDMASHLLWADGYRSAAIAAVNPVASSYPLGPHALVAAMAELLGSGVDLTFAGLTVALPVLLGWTALGALRSPRPWGPFATAPLVGAAFLVAGYYGQGSFKEVFEALLILAVAIRLAFPETLHRRLRWVPVALLLAGTLSVYAHAGLPWPLLFLAIWATGVTVRRYTATRSARAVIARIRAEVTPLLVGAGVLLVAVAPQLPRIVRFASDNVGTNGTGIPTDSLGNLARRLPFWEVFGVWNSADYRVGPTGAFGNGLWTPFVIVLVLSGVVWSVRRGEWMLPAAAAATLLIWLATDRTQSPYVAAKALVLLAPMLMIVAVRPLAERDTTTRRMPSWWGVAAPALTVVLMFGAIGSSWRALTFSTVGPTAHTREIQSLRSLLDGRPTLYLGNDDFTRWIFAGVPVRSPVISFQSMDLRPEKPWVYGDNYDIDSLDSATLNEFDWVVAPRDAAASAPPSQLRLVRRTTSFDVFRRTATIPPRRVLAEGPVAAVPLDCATPQGRAIVAGGGVAAVRDPYVSVSVPVIAPDATLTVELPLTPGRWDLVTPYGGPRPVEVSAPGVRTTLPANLDRPGPRWPIGRITVTRTGLVPVTIHPTSEWLTPASALTYMTTVAAVPVGTEKTVPIAAACGSLVNWYRPARS